MAIIMFAFFFTISLFSQCFAREPYCKQFEYEEKMLSKMIRTEIATEALTKKFESLQEKMEAEVRLISEKIKSNFESMLQSASVDGGWTEWSSWTDCTVTCDVGIQSRYRSCDNPTSHLIGQPCDGSPLEHRSCFIRPCAADMLPVPERATTKIGFTVRRPSYKNGALTFSTVVSNEGEHFNKNTGKFVCKVPGLYYFFATILGGSGTSSAVYCFIKIGSDEKALVYAHTKNTGDYPSGSGSIVYKLKEGDEVYLGGCVNYDNMDVSTHFSGFLIN